MVGAPKLGATSDVAFDMSAPATAHHRSKGGGKLPDDPIGGLGRRQVHHAAEHLPTEWTRDFRETEYHN